MATLRPRGAWTGSGLGRTAWQAGKYYSAFGNYPSASDPNTLAASASSADVILPAYGLPASARHKNFCLSGKVWHNSLGKLWRGTKVTVRFPPLTTRLAKRIFTSKLANLQKDAQALWYPACFVSLGFSVAIFPPLQPQ